MHRRMLAAVFAALLILPVTAAAQRPEQEEVILISGLRVSPFVGFLTPFTRSEEWVFIEGDDSFFAQSEVKVAGGALLGVQVEGPLSNRFGWTAAAGYSSRGDTEFAVLQTGDAFLIDGSHVIMGRLGGALHLHEQDTELTMRNLSASVFAGAVVMHERPRERLGTANVLSSGTHFGVNFGANGEIPFANNRFAVQLGLEDNMMWWSKGALRSLAYAYLGQPGTSEESTSVSADMSHTFLLRLGLQLRL